MTAHQSSFPLQPATGTEGRRGQLVPLTCCWCNAVVEPYWQTGEVTFVERGTGFGQNTSYSHSECHRRAHKDTEAMVGIAPEQAELWT